MFEFDDLLEYLYVAGELDTVEDLEREVRKIYPNCSFSNEYYEASDEEKKLLLIEILDTSKNNKRR